MNGNGLNSRSTAVDGNGKLRELEREDFGACLNVLGVTWQKLQFPINSINQKVGLPVLITCEFL